MGSTLIITRSSRPVTVTQNAVGVTVSGVGPQGPPGIQGIPGATGAGFEETWSSPVSSIIVTHNLGRYPGVAVIVNNQLVIADVTYNSINSITVSFSTPQAAGRVECL